MFRKLCGDAALRSVVLVTNMWDEVSPDTGKAREYELYNNFFKLAMLKGARMFQHHNTVDTAHDIVRMIIPNPPVVLQIQRELVVENKDILNTAAGDAINKELNEQIRRHEAELEEVRAEAEQALGEEDEEARQELEEETKRLQELVEGIKRDSEGLAAEYAAEKERMEARVKEMEQEAEEREMEQARVREMKQEAWMRAAEQEARTRAAEQEAWMREAEQEAWVREAEQEEKRKRGQPDHAPRLQVNASVTSRQTSDQGRLDNLSNSDSVKIPIV